MSAMFLLRNEVKECLGKSLHDGCPSDGILYIGHADCCRSKTDKKKNYTFSLVTVFLFFK